MVYNLKREKRSREEDNNASTDNLVPQDQSAPFSGQPHRRKLKAGAQTPRGSAKVVDSGLIMKGISAAENNTSVRFAMEERCKEYNIEIRQLQEAKSLALGDSKVKNNIKEETTKCIQQEELVEAIFVPKLRLVEKYLKPRTAFQTLLCGDSDSNQLGVLYNKKTEMGCNRFALNTTLQDYPIIQIECGGIHNLALHLDGRTVFSWGVNDAGTLGRPSNPATAPEFDPLPVDFPSEVGLIKKVAAGDLISLALTLDGKIWDWGVFKDSDAKRFCSIAEQGAESKKIALENMVVSSDLKCSRPTQLHLPSGTFVEDVFCGENFVAALTSECGLLTWGYNPAGETGRPVKKVRNAGGDYAKEAVLSEYATPRPPLWEGGVSMKVQTVACGANHLLAIAFAGQGCSTTTVYSCGLNNYGQLGLGDTKNRDKLTKIDKLNNVSVQKVAAGEHFSLCCDENGYLFAFGRGDRLQLGIHDVDMEYTAAGFAVHHPVRVPLAEKAVDIACGGNFCLAKTMEGKLYSWGSGEMGQLGQGKSKDVGRPKKVNLGKSFDFLEEQLDVDVVSISCGTQHSAITCTVVRKN